MIDIKNFIHLLDPNYTVKEDASDITTLTNGCISCNICGSVSGSLLIIPHFYHCTYKNNNSTIIRGERRIASNPIDITIVKNVCQREYSIVNETTPEKIIVSTCAATCIILCMRNRKTTETILAHIDNPTIPFIKPFLPFDPAYTDVYVVGGETISKENIHELLEILQQNHYFFVTFCHLVDINPNKFAIDCRTGETWLNEEVGRIPFSKTEIERIDFFSYGPMFMKKYLNKV